MQAPDLERLDLTAGRVGVDRLYALCVGPDTSPVEAKDTVVLIDADTASWSSWNRCAEEFAHDTGAPVGHVEDGGVTGPTLFEYVRRLRWPVLNNPKGQNASEPTGLVRRPVVHPEPRWTWSLVWRREEGNPVVFAVVDAFTHDSVDLRLLDERGWLPQADPHRAR